MFSGSKATSQTSQSNLYLSDNRSVNNHDSLKMYTYNYTICNIQVGQVGLYIIQVGLRQVVPIKNMVLKHF